MFEIIMNRKKLLAILEAATPVLDEAPLKFSMDGLHIDVADPSNAMMVSVFVPRDLFSSYQIDSEQIVCLDLKKFFDYSSSIESEDVKMTIADSKFHVKVGAQNFGLGIIDPRAIRKTPTMPNLSPTFETTMDGASFIKLCLVAKKVDDQVRFLSDETKGLTMSCANPVDTFNGSMEDLNLNISKKGIADSSFSLRYFVDVGKTISSSKLVTLTLGKDYPCTMRLDFEGVSIVYLLAPRIEQA